MKLKPFAIAAVFSAVTAVNYAAADSENAPAVFSDIDKDFVMANYHRGGDNTILARYLSEKGLFPKKDIDNPDEDILRRSAGLAIEGEEFLNSFAKSIIKTSYKDIIVEQKENIDPKYLHDLQLSLKVMGYLNDAVSGELDTETRNALTKFAPVYDEIYLKDAVGEQIPISFEDGIVKPDASQIGSVLYSINDDALSNGDISTHFDPDKLNDIIRELEVEYSSLSITHPELQDSDGVSVGSEFHYLMTNPHENGGSIAERVRQRVIWESVRDAIEDNGGRVSQIRAENEAGSFRETWTQDHVFILGNAVFVPDINVLEGIFRGIGYPDEGLSEKIGQYQDNLNQATEYLQGQGYDLIKVEGAWFEGGNIIVHGQQTEAPTLFMGVEQYAERVQIDNTQSGQLLVDAISAVAGNEWSYIAVPLIDTKTFYHLDLGMSEELRDGQHFVYPGMTDTNTYQKIQNVIGEGKTLEVDQGTAENFAVNMVVLSDTLITSAPSDALKELAESIGYKVVDPTQYGQSSFVHNKGGAHCMSKRL